VARTIKCITWILLATYGAYFLPVAVDAAQSDKTCVSGVVRNQNGKPVVGALVTAYRIENSEYMEDRTDGDGLFRMFVHWAPTTKFRVGVSKNGYQPWMEDPLYATLLSVECESVPLQLGVFVLRQQNLRDKQQRIQVEQAFREVPSPQFQESVFDDTRRATDELKATAESTRITRYVPLTTCRFQLVCSPPINVCWTTEHYNARVMDQCGRTTVLPSTRYIERAYIDPCAQPVCTYKPVQLRECRAVTTIQFHPELANQICELDRLLERMHEMLLKSKGMESPLRLPIDSTGPASRPRNEKENPSPTALQPKKSHLASFEWSPAQHRSEDPLRRR
jgi:hypothetical protein